MTAKRVFIGTVVVLGTLLGAYLLYRMLSILILLALAFVFASSIAPLVNRLDRKLGLGLSIGLVYLGLFLGLAAMFAVIAQPLVAQATLLVSDAPALLTRVQTQITAVQTRFNLPADTLTPDLRGSYGTLLQRAPSLAGGILRTTLGFVAGFGSSLLVLVMAFYWLLERRNIEGTWLGLVPVHRRGHAREMIQEIEEKAGGYVRGVATLAAIMAVLTFFGLELIGMPFALVLALIAGLAEFIPLAGVFIASAAALLVALSQSPKTALLVLILYTVLQQFENNFLVPKVTQRSGGLSPLTTLVAVLAGAGLLGVVGALLAVPVASAVDVVLKHTILRPHDVPDPASVRAAPIIVQPQVSQPPPGR